MPQKDQKKVAAGRARADSMSASKRSAIAKKAAESRWSKNLPSATYTGEIKIGDASIGCAVLEDETRLLTQSDMMRALGRARQAKGRAFYDADENLPAFLTAKNLRPYISSDLHVASSQIEFRLPNGGRAFGYRAEMLPKVCEVYLKARDAGALLPSQKHVATQADILIRGLANVGIVALVDEATGYQRDRAVDALAKILEEFVAKELRPWVKTFPEEYYEELYRLRDLEFPEDSVKKPAYFGHLTNDIIYKRLAPGVLKELKKKTPKGTTGRHKQQLHRRLTDEVGHPKLVSHLDAVVSIMRIADDGDYDGFIRMLDKAKPRYDETLQLPLRDID